MIQVNKPPILATQSDPSDLINGDLEDIKKRLINLTNSIMEKRENYPEGHTTKKLNLGGNAHQIKNLWVNEKTLQEKVDASENVDEIIKALRSYCSACWGARSESQVEIKTKFLSDIYNMLGAQRIKQLNDSVKKWRQALLDSGFNENEILEIQNNFVIGKNYELVHNGDMNFNKTRIRALPQGLTRINGNLIHNKNENIMLTNHPITVNGDVDLRKSGIENLPKIVTNNLYISNSSVSKLTEGTTVNKNFNMDNCKKLSIIPNNFTVHGHFSAQEALLKDIGDNFNVGKSCFFRECKFDKIPENCSIGEDLFLFDCAIKNLPTNFKSKFDGNIVIERCSELDIKEDEINKFGSRKNGEKRVIIISDCKQSVQEIIEYLKEHPYDKSVIIDSDSGKHPLFHKYAVSEYLDRAFLGVNKNQQHPKLEQEDQYILYGFIYNYIRKFEQDKNKHNKVSRVFKDQISSILTKMKDNSWFCRKVIEEMSYVYQDESFKSYEHYLFFIDKIDRLRKETDIKDKIISGSISSENEVISFVQQELIINEILNYKFKYQKNYSIYLLAYLKEKFNLSLIIDLEDVEKPRFLKNGKFNIDEEVGDVIEKKIKIDENFNRYYKKSDLKKLYSRYQDTQKTPFSELPEEELTQDIEESTCPITQVYFKDLTNPIIDIDGNVYEFEDYKNWYVERGTSPTNREKINWNDLKRVVKPS